MLGVGGRFASSKGMVKVPSLTGLSRAAAQSAIEAAGLVYGGFSDTVVADSGLDDKVANQNILANTLVDYETIISLTRYRYEAPPVVPSYPPIPADNGQIILGNCVISGGEISYPENEAYCDGTTRVQPAYQIYRRVDKKVTYTEGPSFTWIRSEVSQPSVICNSIFSSNFNTSNSPLCVNCSVVEETKTFEGANTNCASGRGYYKTDTYPTGCTPSSTTVQTTCVPVAEPTPVVTLQNTIFGDCLASTGTSTAGVPCSSNGGGRRTRRREYSDGSVINDTVCCEYTPPAPTCTPTTNEGNWSTCTATGLAPGTKSRTVTETYADCSKYTYQETVQCCIAFCGPFSTYSPSCIGAPYGTKQTRTATCVSSINCNQYTKTESRCCVAEVISLGTCTSTPYGRYRTRTVTSYNADCTVTTSTSNVSC